MMKKDSSSSSISTPTNPIPSEQPLQVEVITYMDNDLFEAAENGDMELFNKYQGGLHCLVDGKQNTALHIYSRTGGRRVVKNDKRFLCFQKKRFEREFSINFVEQLVDKWPSLLLQPNAKGEIPLHIAARHGHSDIVKVLFERAKVVQREDLEKGLEATWRLKQMLRMRDKDGNTAMHKAVKSGKLDVVQLLVKELDPDFSFSANKSGETPVYIAAKAKRNLLVAEISDNCNSIMDYGGPDGRTALHAAVIVRDELSVRKLIHENKQLTKKTDNNGWTPLHYAAHYGCRSIGKLLLESDASAAYITDKQRGMAALHLAAWRGRKAIMEDIISHCPGCCEIVDKRGWNFLHFAAVTLTPFTLERLVGDINETNNLPITNLVDEKDANGVTPFHVLVFGPVSKWYHQLMLGRERVFGFFERHASEKYAYIRSSSEIKKQVRESSKDIANDAKVAGLSIHFLFREIAAEERDIPLQEVVDKVRESHLVVATLIATVTFTAAFTVPGGYKSDGQGTATLFRDSAFKAFVITDTLAFVFSLLAIFLHFMAVLFQWRFKGYIQAIFIIAADCFTIFATSAMVLAFSTGIYAVTQSSLWFAIATLSLSLISFSYIIGVLIYNFWGFFLDVVIETI